KIKLNQMILMHLILSSFELLATRQIFCKMLVH
ncbi:uncharacterized protein Dmoj_GI25952, partial [Drosophila mojavensis]